MFFQYCQQSFSPMRKTGYLDSQARYSALGIPLNLDDKTKNNLLCMVHSEMSVKFFTSVNYTVRLPASRTITRSESISVSSR